MLEYSTKPQEEQDIRGGDILNSKIKIADLLAKISDFWWGMVDSNHRRQCQQIYSLSPLATREIPHIKLLELVDGLEPPTC